MLLDAALPPTSLTAIPTIAHAAEAMGFDTLWSSETMHDPFLPGPLAGVITVSDRPGNDGATRFNNDPGGIYRTALVMPSWSLAN